MRWDAFTEACAQIAEIASQRFAGDEVVMLGTIRADGSPRLSPCEVDIAAGRLLFGMMWHSRKAQDLLRDPRLLVHSIPQTRINPGGDVKLRGLAVDERDPGVRETYREALLARIDWAPDEPEFHCFSLDVGSAGYVRFSEDAFEIWRWSPEAGLSKETRPND